MAASLRCHPPYGGLSVMQLPFLTVIPAPTSNPNECINSQVILWCHHLLVCLGARRHLFIRTQEYSSMVITSSGDFRVTTMILRMPGYITSSLEDIYIFHMCQILGGIHRLTSSHQLLLTRNQQLLGHSRISHEPCVPTKHFPWWVSFLFTTQDHRFCSPASLETKQSL